MNEDAVEQFVPSRLAGPVVSTRPPYSVGIGPMFRAEVDCLARIPENTKIEGVC